MKIELKSLITIYKGYSIGFFKDLLLNLKYKRKKFKYIGDNVSYKQMNSKFLFSKNITLEKNSKVLDYAMFDGVGGITIGACTIVAPECTILTSNHQYDENKIELLPFNNELVKKAVLVQEYCWVGRRVMIMPGVTIGKGSIVAAGSVVTKDIESYSIVGGNPAKLIKTRDKNKVEQLIQEGKCWNDPSVNVDTKKVYK